MHHEKTQKTNQRVSGTRISPVFRAKDDLDPLTQQWKVNNSSTLHSFMSLSDSMYVNKDGDYSEREIKGFRFSGAKGSEWVAIQKSATSGNTYWGVEADGNINFAFSKDPVNYEFEFIPVNGESDIQAAEYDHLKVVKTVYYSPEGIGSPTPHRGINIRMTTYENGTVRKDKIIIK